MKALKVLTGTLLTASLLGGAFLAHSAENTPPAKIKPYTLKYCVVSGDKLGSMDEPYVFTNGTRQIKLCCKHCLKDFKKDPAKYIKKIEQGEAKEKAKSKPAKP